MSFTLVTGGAKNLGREICLRLAENQLNVALHYNKSDKQANLTVNECRSFGVHAEAIHGDFSTEENIKKFIDEYMKRFPKTQNLINNVGNYLVKSALETTIDEMETLFQVNLYAPFLLMKSLIPSIREERGSIINIGVAGIDHFRAENYSTAYSMTKQNLLLLTKSLAKELATFDVAVNMISPGMLENSADAPKILKTVPMNRLGTFKEVAEVAAFLLDKKNHYITGQNIEIAGGVRL